MLKVFDTVHGLEAALLACGSLAKDILVYLAVLAQLEAVLRLLTNNCCLAWLAGREATTRGEATLGFPGARAPG